MFDLEKLMLLFRLCSMNKEPPAGTFESRGTKRSWCLSPRFPLATHIAAAFDKTSNRRHRSLETRYLGSPCYLHCSYILLATRMATAKTAPRSLHIKPLAEETDDLEPIMPAVAQSHESAMTSHVEIREIPNKGKGVVAVTSIPLGTRVLSEEPLLVCQCLPDKANLNSLLADKPKRMPLESQRGFLSLYNKDAGGPHPLAGIFDTNSFPLGGAAEGAVYPTVCRLNHSCRPNCMASWNATLRWQTVHAVRRIEEGEEL